MSDNETPKKRASSLLEVKDVALQLGLNYCTVLEFIKAGKLRAIRFGKRRYKLRQVDVDAFIEASMTGQEPTPIVSQVRSNVPGSATSKKGAKPGKFEWMKAYEKRSG